MTMKLPQTMKSRIRDANSNNVARRIVALPLVRDEDGGAW